MSWTQNYSPILDSIPLSALVAAIPIVTLLVSLAFFRVKAHFAALFGFAVAVLLSLAVYKMPIPLTLAAGAYGAAFGLFPIGWILLNAIFIYNLSVESGGFKVIQDRMAQLSNDQRIQALMIAFGFGAFLEGFAGFGAPVAISGALMVGLGFRPLDAAKAALLANTVPVAYGSVGIPIITLAKVTGLEEAALCAMVGRQLPFFALIVPFWIVAALSGWRSVKSVWPACLAVGVTYATTQFLVSNFHGPSLVNAASGLAAILSLVILLRFWKPKGQGSAAPVLSNKNSATASDHLRAWLPWALLTLFVVVSSLASVKTYLNQIYAPLFDIPFLHNNVIKVQPAVAAPTPELAQFKWDILSATGTALLLAGMSSSLILGLGWKSTVSLYLATIKKVQMPLLTIALMLALGFTTRYSGSDTTMGLALASSGFLFPFFSPLLGWLGVAVTGSNTSSNVLFGNLQKVSAIQLDLPPVLTTSANASGGVFGKIINAQGIVVVGTAIGGKPDSPDAGTILRSVFWHSFALSILMGLLVILQAYVFPWLIVSTH